MIAAGASLRRSACPGSFASIGSHRPVRLHREASVVGGVHLIAFRIRPPTRCNSLTHVYV
jgi:hypothetical protein